MLEKTLLKITRILDKNRIPYMLIGGYAMVIHGFPRLTQDLDISLGIDTERISDVLKAVEDDFKTLVNDPMAFARDTNVLLLQDTETGIRIDLIFTFIEFERKAIDEAVEIEFKGEKIRNVSLENLIVYKMLAGRERDKEDVEMILAEKIDSVDARNISDIIREMSSILQNDSYESWNSILSKFK
ncbi:MAG: nucleotidyl transferase AbiEii/AbiGii toxin family protein [Victivallales bacterium]